MRIASAEESAAFYNELLEQGIKPRAMDIATITITGEIAVVMWDVAEGSMPAARKLGFDGTTPVFKMARGARKRMAAVCASMGDAITPRWLAGKRTGRIFVISGSGTWLVNFTEDRGYSIEPGSNRRALA